MIYIIIGRVRNCLCEVQELYTGSHSDAMNITVSAIFDIFAAIFQDDGYGTMVRFATANDSTMVIWAQSLAYVYIFNLVVHLAE